MAEIKPKLESLFKDWKQGSAPAKKLSAVGGKTVQPPALAAALKASGATLACLCSSDKVYEKEAVAAAEALKAAGARHIYLAGRPRDQEAAWKMAGVQSFVYEGCDVLTTLQAAHQVLSALHA